MSPFDQPYTVPPTLPAHRLRHQRGLGLGDPDRHRDQHARRGDPGRRRPGGGRDHPGRQDRLRHQRGLGLDDPDRYRDQHARRGDPGRNFPSAVAITPDGKTAYVTNFSSGSVTPIETATNTPGPAIAVGSFPSGVAVTPDGKTAYVTNQDSMIPINTATNTPGAAIPVGSGPIGVAITPDGKTAYVTNFSSDSVTPIDTATNTPSAAIPVGNFPSAVAITPDGKTAYVTNFSSDSVTPIETATNTPGPAIAVGSFPVAVAVTPDQGPVAGFSPTTAAAGQAASFDASASSDPDGTVASYHWDFGDGGSQTTTSPTTTHAYATAAAYTVTLTVTDDAGCSTAQTFTGQTVSCNGSPAAQTSDQVITSGVTASPTGITATPRIATEQQPASATVGSSIADKAMISGGDNPTGTVTFKLYENPNAAGTPLFTDTEPLSTGTATSKRYTATAPGTDYWVATYNGDGNNRPVSSASAEEPVTLHTAVFPNNHFTVSQIGTHRNGIITFRVKVPGAGRLDVLETAWNDNLAHAAVLLQPAPRRFVFARAHRAAHQAGTLHVRVTPNARGKRLVHHHTYRVTLRLWATYTPTGGKYRKQGFYGLHLPITSRPPRPTAAIRTASRPRALSRRRTPR
jgi:YVTN family beta-propeller protein